MRLDETLFRGIVFYSLETISKFPSAVVLSLAWQCSSGLMSSDEATLVETARGRTRRRAKIAHNNVEPLLRLIQIRSPLEKGWREVHAMEVKTPFATSFRVFFRHILEQKFSAREYCTSPGPSSTGLKTDRKRK